MYSIFDILVLNFYLFITSNSGWAATIKYNEQVRRQFEAFRQRENTFSLGVCNGCQLLGLLGWVAQEQQGECQLYIVVIVVVAGAVVVMM